MTQNVKILHVDLGYKVTYLIYRPASSIQTAVSLAEALNLLKTIDFDLIIDEPNNHAILNGRRPNVPAPILKSE